MYMSTVIDIAFETTFQWNNIVVLMPAVTSVAKPASIWISDFQSSSLLLPSWCIITFFLAPAAMLEYKLWLQFFENPSSMPTCSLHHIRAPQWSHHRWVSVSLLPTPCWMGQAWCGFFMFMTVMTQYFMFDFPLPGPSPPAQLVMRARACVKTPKVSCRQVGAHWAPQHNQNHRCTLSPFTFHLFL